MRFQNLYQFYYFQARFFCNMIIDMFVFGFFLGYREYKNHFETIIVNIQIPRLVFKFEHNFQKLRTLVLNAIPIKKIIDSFDRNRFIFANYAKIFLAVE